MPDQIRTYGLLRDGDHPEVTYSTLAEASAAQFRQPGTFMVQWTGEGPDGGWREVHSGLTPFEYRTKRDLGLQ